MTVSKINKVLSSSLEETVILSTLGFNNFNFFNLL